MKDIGPKERPNMIRAVERLEWIPEKTVAIEERKLGIFYEGRITDADTDFKDFTIAIQTESTYDGFFEIKKIEPDQYSIRLTSELF